VRLLVNELYEDYGFVGCDALKFLRQHSTFRKNLLPGAAS